MCERTYKNKSDYLGHKKKNYAHIVKECKNSSNGSCRFGQDRCWLMHNNNETMEEHYEIENVLNEENEVGQRIFLMMEKMTYSWAEEMVGGSDC